LNIYKSTEKKEKIFNLTKKEIKNLENKIERIC